MSETRSPRVIYDVRATLEVQTPLHVGAGRSVTIDTVVGKSGSESPEVAAIVRDAARAPYLPGTTIKGLLRRLAEAHVAIDGDCVDRLFGYVKSDDLDRPGKPGSVTVFGARCTRTPAVADAPFVAGAEQQLGPGVFVAARTRIDPVSGTAGDHKLFHQEMVAQGANFELRLRIDARAPVSDADLAVKPRADIGRQTERAARTDRDAHAKAAKTLQDLMLVLRALCHADGQAIGKGQADGFGRIRLLPDSLSVSGRALQSDGKFVPFAPADPVSLASQAAQPVTGTARLRFFCKGPFLVVDASRQVKPGENAQGERPHISPQRWRERLPMLLGSSVAGALRARARWLLMRRLLQSGKGDDEIRAVDPDEAHFGRGANPNDLSSVQRLFGITGFRGRLGIDSLRVHEAAPWDVTSVKLDRFTGGPVDNALFKTRAFVGVTFDLGLGLEALRSRQLGAEQRADDETMFAELLADIGKNGLILGHGGNKGFGWFRCEDKR